MMLLRATRELMEDRFQDKATRRQQDEWNNCNGIGVESQGYVLWKGDQMSLMYRRI